MRPLILGLLLALCAATARAAVVTYPGAAPCDTTLQACVTGTTAGNVIQIATNAPIAETVTIDKSLTVTAAPGFTPDVEGGIVIEGAATATAVTIQGLITEGIIGAEPGSGNLDLSILDNIVRISASPFTVGIFITSEITGPFGNVTADIRRNQVSVSTSITPCSGIVFGPINDLGSDRVNVVDNTIATDGCGLGAALLVTNGADEALGAFVFGNRVTATGTNNGILVATKFPSFDGSLSAVVANNLVTGQTSIAGLAAGIGSDWVKGSTLSFAAIDNTVSGNVNGILIDGDDGPATSFSGLVANNIIALNAGEGFTVDPAFTVTNHHNLVFGNTGGDFFTPGPATLTIDPLFVGAGDFHLQQVSPAINAGDNGAVPSGVAVDLDGNSRIVGSAVDLGALEAPDVSVAEVPTLSSFGLAAMALTLAAGALLFARRRARSAAERDVSALRTEAVGQSASAVGRETIS